MITKRGAIALQYYDQPWITANWFGGATTHQPKPDLLDFGYEYLFASALFGSLAYLIILKYI